MTRATFGTAKASHTSTSQYPARGTFGYVRLRLRHVRKCYDFAHGGRARADTYRPAPDAYMHRTNYHAGEVDDGGVRPVFHHLQQSHT
jgi:hypothetical protein